MFPIPLRLNALSLVNDYRIVTLSALLGISATFAQDTLPTPTGQEIVAKHSITLNSPAGEPTQRMARGPLLGNGDVGVMQSGPAEELTYYIGKNDFWGINSKCPLAVGKLCIFTPALQGATFQTVSDMGLAEIRGDYVNGEAAMTSRAWVDANQNLLCVELTNKGSKALPIQVKNFMGGSLKPVPTIVSALQKPPKLGCEQSYRGDRWHFIGEMADLKVFDRALSPEEIATLAKAERKDVQTFDGKAGKPFTAPGISNVLTIAGWIKAAALNDHRFIISTGEIGTAYSLSLMDQRLNFTIDKVVVSCGETFPLNEWVHVAAVFDGKQMALFVDGKLKKDTKDPRPDMGASYLYEPDASDPDGRKVGLASRVIGVDSPAEFTLAPGKSVVVATAVLSDLDTKGANPLEAAKALVASLTTDQIIANTAAHRKWWSDFWSRSFIEIPDKKIEEHWYASWYIMASCSRAGKVAPGLWGNWITNYPDWNGDFHMNYNFEAPFCSLYSANHAETTLPYYDAMNQSIPRGRKIAAERGWKGIHLPVAIGPWGRCPVHDDWDFGQRSNAAYAALPFIWYWQHTRDKEWLKTTGYTYLRETAAFWEDYLKYENGRYVIHGDAPNEVSGSRTNPITSLALVKFLFSQIIPMSEALGVDADKRAKWRDIVEKLSPIEVKEKDGKLFFSSSVEDGPGHPFEHIFPAGAIGLDSDPKFLEAARKMIDDSNVWNSSNYTCWWYAACARVGYDPKKILKELRNIYDRCAYSNDLMIFDGGGIENVSSVLGVTEMLLQSHEGVIRFFPDWPKDLDARFGTLRANGAFLVSAELKNGIVSGVKITSEKGGDCTVVNPWPDKKVTLVRNGKPAEILQGNRFTFKTSAGEKLALEPAK